RFRWNTRPSRNTARIAACVVRVRRCYEADEGPPQSSLTLLRPDFAIEGDYQMVRTTFTLSANTLHCALELSKNSWLLAIQCPDREQPSLHSIECGNTEKLMAKLIAARDC
ncbi:MAG TPA: hypothetical protein VNO32_53985, partial [Candidatus Acidoferrum sp.]|nr:hypothetical protein [Candidatus Acidoferrum sp.]